MGFEYYHGDEDEIECEEVETREAVWNEQENNWKNYLFN